MLRAALILVVLLEALLILGLVARTAGLLTALDVDVALLVLRGALVMVVVLIDVDVAVLLKVGLRAAMITLDVNIAVLLNAPGGSITVVNVDLPLDLLSVLGCVLVDVDIDVGLFLGRLGLWRRLDGLQTGQEAENLAETVVRDVQLLLSVLKLLLLAQQPVHAVPDANASTVLHIASDALGVRRDVLKRATDVSHGAIDPFGLLRIRLEGVVDFADGKKALDFVEIGSHAANNAHVDGIRRTNVANAFGLVQELAELVGTANRTRGGAEGEDLSFNHSWC